MRPARGLALGGALLAAPLAAAGLPGVFPGCPVLAITGLPCPTCGGTRAVHLLFDGDPDFLRYNAFWALIVAFAWVALAIASWRRLRGRPAIEARLAEALTELRARPAAVASLVIVLAFAGWLTAMVNLESIRAV